ncbi:MAG: DUF4922 domain-containing protein [Duncaniella sp.]|nr:DUF4922 domain-containing protein [Duncaniella sp.]
MTLSEAREIIAHQCNVWPLCRKNYDALQNVERRQLRDSTGKLITTLLHNPARIGSSAARPASERPCFLCHANRPAEQDVIYHGDYEILVNPFPVFPVHFTISYREHEPQAISGHVKAMLEFSDVFPELTVFYNGPHCGASAPDHHHFQAADFTFDHTIGDNDITAGDNYIEIASHYDELIIKEFGRLLSVLPSQETEPMMNILLSRLEDGRKCLTVFPRRRHRPSCYGDIIISPASVEMAGYMVTPRRDDFYSLTADKAKEIIEEVSLTPLEIKNICNRLSQ